MDRTKPVKIVNACSFVPSQCPVSSSAVGVKLLTAGGKCGSVVPVTTWVDCGRRIAIPLSRLWLKDFCVPLVDGWQGSYVGDRARRAPSWCSHSGIRSSSRGNEEHSSLSYDDLGSYDQSQTQEKEPLEIRPESEDIEVAKLFSSRYGQLTDRRQDRHPALATCQLLDTSFASRKK